MKNLIPSPQTDQRSFTAQENNHRQRLDNFLHEVLPEYSRSYFQRIIQNGLVTINGTCVKKPGHAIKTGDTVVCKLECIDFNLSAAHIDKAILADIDVKLIAQEPDFLIINKPAGLVVHKPAHTSRQVTLVDWLLGAYPHLESIGQADRPGIVHRLDMQTSGLMIIPRTNGAHAQFSFMFKERLIKKIYTACIVGHPPERDVIIDYRIMRHPTERTKMAPSKSQGRQATTHMHVIEYLKGITLINAFPQTGRTHQIRVHCAAWGFPILGDTVYGASSNLIKRHALHAAELIFDYQGKSYHFTAPLPDDMRHVVLACQTKAP